MKQRTATNVLHSLHAGFMTLTAFVVSMVSAAFIALAVCGYSAAPAFAQQPASDTSGTNDKAATVSNFAAPGVVTARGSVSPLVGPHHASYGDKFVTIDQAEFIQTDSVQPPGNAEWIPVTLPDSWQKQKRPRRGIGWYRLSVAFPDNISSSSTAISLYIPRATNNVAIYINGSLSGVSGDIENREMNWNIAQYFSVPVSLLRPGANEILIRLHPDGYGRPGISKVVIGESTPILKMWEKRYFVQNTAPKFITAFAFFSGLLGLWIWLHRRTEAMFGLFALMCFVSIVRIASYIVRDYASPFNYLAVPSLGVLTALQLSFVLRFADTHSPRFERIVWIFTVIATLLILVVPDQWAGNADEIYNISVGCIGIACLIVLTHALSRTLHARNVLMIAAIMVNAVFGMHDLANYAEMLGFDRLYILPLGMPLFVVAVAALLVTRFVGTLNQYEARNAELSDRVNEREKQLAVSFEQLRQSDQERATAEERQRLMRDMHDGIGSHLMSTLALARMGSLSNKDMTEVLADCIDELKLTIDSLEPVERDLLVVLGNLRYRLEPRLNAANITLEWAVSDLPPLPYLDPQNIRSVLRIVQEAFTNTLKHANAKRITIATGIDTVSHCVFVRIIDDGVGAGMDADIDVGMEAEIDIGIQAEIGSEPPAKNDARTTENIAAPANRKFSGRGIDNMKSRAEKLGGKVEFVAMPDLGTCVTLYLPIR